MFPAHQPEPVIELGSNQSGVSQPELPAAESLQFQKAEIQDETAGRRCSACGGAVPGEYYQVAGAIACPRCAQARLASRQRRGGPSEFARAALFGLGGAVAGSALTAIVALTVHIRIGFLAIVVGVMVGKAVLMGARGCRGRRYQVLALLLTYGGIASSYLPEVLTGLRQAEARIEAQQKAAGRTPPAAARPKGTAAQLVVALVVVTAFSLAAPFFLLSQGSGIIDAIIIAIGLRQAWRLTRPDRTAILGPYTA